MKTGRLVAVLLLAGACWPLSASAQGVPRGSYLRTCENVYIRGDTLIATCRRADGYARQSALPAVQSCVGDIGNRNGTPRRAPIVATAMNANRPRLIR